MCQGKLLVVFRVCQRIDSGVSFIHCILYIVYYILSVCLYTLILVTYTITL